MTTAKTPDDDRLVTIDYFVKQMLGLKSRQWYYLHKADRGMPQPVYLAPRVPRLFYRECDAYRDRLIRATRVKRHRGRPAKPAATA